MRHDMGGFVVAILMVWSMTYACSEAEKPAPMATQVAANAVSNCAGSNTNPALSLTTDTAQNTSTATNTAISTSTATTTSSGVNASEGCSTLPPAASADPDLADLLNSEKANNCKMKNLVVNRDVGATGTAECFGATLDMSWCNKAGIVAKFQELIGAGPATETQVNRILGDGFTIDQCGVEGTKPLATFYKKVPSESRLDLRVIRPK